MQRIGLFGGSFDPVHVGHLLAAQAASEELELEKVYFIPAAQSPFKPDRTLAPGEERLKLLRLALAGQTRYGIDGQEIHRGGVSYTIDTVREYARRFAGAELFYLVGADQVGQLPKWREANDLAGLVEFVIIPRPGQANVNPPAHFRIRSLMGFPLGVSSSQIRERIRTGRSIEFLVGSVVAEAIRNNRLYL